MLFRVISWLKFLHCLVRPMQHSSAPRVQTAYNESARTRKEHEMNTRKLCLRLAVFLCTLTIALCVTRPFLIPSRDAIRVNTLPTFATPAQSRINYKVRFVTV